MDSQFEIKQFSLLRNVVDNIIPPKSIAGFTDYDLANCILDCLKESANRLKTPIWRRENAFFVYQNFKPYPFSKSNLYTLLKCTARKIGMAERIHSFPFFRIYFSTKHGRS